MERAFKGIWIPKEVWLDKNLNWTEKLMLVEISSLDNDKGCYASNTYFAEFFGLSNQRISQIINSLIKKQYIKAEYIYEGKECKKRVLNIFNRGIKYILGGYQENFKENNISINNIDFNNIKNKEGNTVDLSSTSFYKNIDDMICNFKNFLYSRGSFYEIDFLINFIKKFYTIKTYNHGILDEEKIIELSENIKECFLSEGIVISDNEQKYFIDDYFNQDLKYYSIQNCFSKENIKMWLLKREYILKEDAFDKEGNFYK